MTTGPDSSSYIDYDAFLDPSFSAASFANTLVTSTNNASDNVVDLSTPLSRVLFDVQEIDTHLHNISTSSALPLLEHARTQNASAQTVVSELEKHVRGLTERYKQLEEDVVKRHEVAEEVRLAASRLWVTVKIGRAVQRSLLLGRQLDANMEEALRPRSDKVGAEKGGGRGRDARPGSKDGIAAPSDLSAESTALVRAAHSILTLKALLASSGPGEEGEHLSRINVVATLRTDLLAPAEQRLRGRAQQIVREFSLSSVPAGSGSTVDATSRSSTPSQSQTSRGSTPTSASVTLPTISFAQSSAARSRTAAAAQVLYLLSPPPVSRLIRDFQPTLLISACEAYLRAALTASSTSIARALAALSTLPRVLGEVAARCQNVAALERALQATRVPEHALLLTLKDFPEDPRGPSNGTLSSASLTANLLAHLLDALDTASLPSYFWRSLAGDIGARVQELLGRGGVGARQLRAHRDTLRVTLREAVVKGCEGALGADGREVHGGGGWEREVGVMVGSVLGPLR